MGKTIEIAENNSGGAKLYIQGEGNTLKFIEVEQTVDSVVERAKKIHKKNKELCTVELSIGCMHGF